MTTEEVFAVLQGERDYQLRRWGLRTACAGQVKFADKPHTVGDFVGYMRHYMNEVDKALATQTGTEAGLEMLRKVVTLGVACFEQHGVAQRDMTRGVINGHDGLPA